MGWQVTKVGRSQNGWHQMVVQGWGLGHKVCPILLVCPVASGQSLRNETLGLQASMWVTRGIWEQGGRGTYTLTSLQRCGSNRFMFFDWGHNLCGDSTEDPVSCPWFLLASSHTHFPSIVPGMGARPGPWQSLGALSSSIGPPGCSLNNNPLIQCFLLTSEYTGHFL